VLLAIWLLVGASWPAPVLAVPLILDPDPPPETPLPEPPPPLAPAPAKPKVAAPDARALLEACPSNDFVECFRDWKPPAPPPPPPATASAAPEKGGQPHKTNMKEAEKDKPAGDASGPKKPPPLPSPPPINQAADVATYEALLKAVQEMGLEKHIILPDPPKEGKTIMRVSPDGQLQTDQKETK